MPVSEAPNRTELGRRPRGGSGGAGERCSNLSEVVSGLRQLHVHSQVPLPHAARGMSPAHLAAGGQCQDHPGDLVHRDTGPCRGIAETLAGLDRGPALQLHKNPHCHLHALLRSDPLG
jgi:hypothetical protein